MRLSRRAFVQASSMMVAGAKGAHLGAVRAQPDVRRVAAVLDGPTPEALAATAVDAARAAGASYADARLTITRNQKFVGSTPSEEGELLGAGVRVLVKGVWGFLSSALWTTDEMARLARGAVDQATAQRMDGARTVDLGRIPIVTRGHWTMPVKYDPFDIPDEEKLDVMNDAQDYARSVIEGRPLYTEMSFLRQRKVFASSEEASWEQISYVSGGQFILGYREQYSRHLHQGHAAADFLSPAGKGWEHITESGLIDHIPALIDAAEQSRHVIPVDPNMYDVVFSASAMAALVDATIGTATELDRALGYEANAGGTSFLDNPLEMLGTYKLGAALLNVTADRSTPGGAATVQWDDDGVTPETFSLVKDGVLTDFQTTREQAAWLAPYYQKKGIPVRSHGCAASESGLTSTTQLPANLRLLPGASDTSFEELVSNIRNGLAVLTLEPHMDQQQRNGVAYPVMRQIRNGKLGPFVADAALVFQTSELWKNLIALGGRRSERWVGITRKKGEPSQEFVHSVGAVPGVIRNMRVLHGTRGV